MPADRLASPDAGVPLESLLVDGSEHDKSQPGRGELRPNSERHADTTRDFGATEENRESLAFLDASGALLRST
jgi:hypothetical protein